MTDTCVSPGRLAEKVAAAIKRLRLDLSGLRVVTEAATGAYVVTPVLAAAAGAQVVALTRESRYGTVGRVRAETQRLAAEMGVAARIRVVESLADRDLEVVDVVTNSGHVRPIDEGMVGRLKPTAVISLMYEAWELRAADVDLAACRRRGIRVAGTNERHADVGVFDYLGLVVLKAMLEAGHDLIDERCLLLSDNDFAPSVRRTLEVNGARVTQAARPTEAGPGPWDTVVIACTPPGAGGRPVRLDGVRGDLYCQLWGDVDRTGAAGQWRPEQPHPPGHMGLALQSLGPVPVVKLQAGGLKVAEVMLRDPAGPYAALAQWVVGQPPAPGQPGRLLSCS